MQECKSLASKCVGLKHGVDIAVLWRLSKAKSPQKKTFLEGFFFCLEEEPNGHFPLKCI